MDIEPRVCTRDNCTERVVRTGSRGPWPTRCPIHRKAHKREGWRQRKRKQRGTQRVLVRWPEPRLLTWRERARRRLYRLSDAVTVEAERTIVDIDLSRERDPADKAQALFDDFVTNWLVGCERREWRCEECDGSWRGEIDAFRIEVKYCSPACRRKAAT